MTFNATLKRNDAPRVVRFSSSLPPEDVYIGRGSKWGNPFRIGWDGTREEVIARYAEWIKTKPELLAALPELRGRNLACYCAPKACHGDILLKLANR